STTTSTTTESSTQPAASSSRNFKPSDSASDVNLSANRVNSTVTLLPQEERENLPDRVRVKPHLPPDIVFRVYDFEQQDFSNKIRIGQTVELEITLRNNPSAYIYVLIKLTCF